MNCLRGGFQFYPAAVFFKVPLGLLRKAHAVVVTGPDDQQLCPLFVNISGLLQRNRMGGAANLFGQLFLAFFNRAIQPQDNIVSDFPPFDGDGAEDCGINSGPDDIAIFSFPFFVFSYPYLFCLSFSPFFLFS